MRRSRAWIWVPVLSVVIVSSFAASAFGVVFLVTKTEDTWDGACTADDCSLREAINEANRYDGTEAVMVLLPAGTFKLTIPPADRDDQGTGDLDIYRPMTVEGFHKRGSSAKAMDAQNTTTIDGNGIDRVFDVHAGAGPVTFYFLNIKGGIPHIKQSTAESLGGGIKAESTNIAVNYCHIFLNQAHAAGGGIYSKGGSVEIKFSHIEKNSAFGADGVGGGIYMEYGGGLIIERSTISENSAQGEPGGLYAQTFSWGFIDNSTFYKNKRGDINAAETDDLLIINSTIVSNDMVIPGLFLRERANIRLYNTILWTRCSHASNEPFEPLYCMGDPTRTCYLEGLGFNFPIYTDPLLFPLGQYGGLTPTAPPMPGSLAIDPVWNLPDCGGTDQRGKTRPVDGNGEGDAGCDIGAVESRNFFFEYDPVLEFQNNSDEACNPFKNGIMRRARVALFVMDVGDSEPRFWDELVFDGSIGPGKSESIRFDWPLAKGTPSGFAKLFWTLELVMENPEAGAGTSQPTAYSGPGPPVPPDPTPPDPTPPDPTPPGPPRPKTFSVWAFDGKDPNFRGRPPRVPVAVDEEHTRVKFYLFGEQCPDTPVGKVYFHLVKN